MKKLLVIVYYWPPCGGVGVQRWLRFIKYLPQLGWEPTVLTTYNGDYPAIDESLLKNIPKGIKVIRTKTPTFSGMYRRFSKKGESKIPHGSLEINPTDSPFKKMSIWIRLNLVIPDARKIWNKFAYQAARKELLKNKYDAVITTGPPHSTHLIGLKLKKKFNINWIADFRDPWTQMGYLKNVKRLKITSCFDGLLENKVVKTCDTVIAASQKIISDLNCSPDKIHLITNGFDPQDYKEIQKKKIDENFNLNYFGTLPPESNPISVLEAITQLYKKGLTDIKMNFWGNTSVEVIEQLNKLDDSGIVKFHKHTDHNKAIELMFNSSMLLLMINNVKNNEGIITAKIFEYMGSGVTILGVGPTSSEPATILYETGSGKMFQYEKVDEIAEYIESVYKLWKQGKEIGSKDIEKYSCVNLTKKLDVILNKFI
ncbi:MAG: glycosyltransferase family 4 protein [Candidatus Cloacimonetes bacterium]|nr:glycosyltransferase family 4 protein [Candidatus Cloacimonadota bacterium]